MRREAAFTLVELLVVLVVAAIGLSLAIPSFRTLVQGNRAATAVNTFITALMSARSEAIKRGRRVTVCKSADGATCAASGGYEQGFIVFVDVNDDATVSDTSLVLRVFDALPNLTARGNYHIVDYVSYLPSGLNAKTSGAMQPGTVKICAGDVVRHVAISNTGRPRVEAGAAGDCS